MSRTYRGFAGVLLVGLLALALAACGGASGGGNGGKASGNGQSSTATAAPKPKPTGVPQITAAYCQQLMTIAEANQIMHPATAATTIRVDNSPAGGSCNYEYSQFHTVVSVLFLPFRQGASLDAIATQSLAQVNDTSGDKVTKTAVSGVGDQALYIAASISGDSPTAYFYALDTTVGGLYISCFNETIGSPPATAQQPTLMQVCQQVVSRL